MERSEGPAAESSNETTEWKAPPASNGELPAAAAVAPEAEASTEVAAAPTTNADVPSTQKETPVADVDAPTTNGEVPVSAAVETLEADTTDIDTHKTAAAPKSILKESRIAAVENKTQSQINKWIKGDSTKKTMELPTKPHVDGKPETEPKQPDAPKQPEAPKPSTATTDFFVIDEILPEITPRDDSFDGQRKRRLAAKTVLKPVDKRPKADDDKPAAVTKPVAATKPASKPTEPTAAKPSTVKPPPKATKVTPTKARKTAAKPVAKGPSPEVWSGVPDDKLGDGFEWPAGWTKKKFERQSGLTKGTLDAYWYTPVLQRKLRSLNEVKRFMKALADCGGDEAKAWTAFKK
jgi:hypothetical protein